MKNPFFVALYMMAVAGIIAGATVFGNKLLVSHTDATTMCTKTGATHVVQIQNNSVQPATVSASRCDKLQIINLDADTREIGFGAHEHHEQYDGVAEKVVRQNDSLTITLIQAGTFHFHDHFHDEAAGSFMVTR